MRNDLLAQIVIASGGTVTNKDDRNALLSDWLAAVSSPKVEVARLDGATQYWQLSAPIELQLGGRVEIDLYRVNDYFKLFDSTADRFDVTVFNGAITERNDCLIYVDGALTNQVPLSGVEYAIKLDRDASIQDKTRKEISIIGARFNAVEFLQGYVKGLRVYNSSGVLTNEIPLTNKAQGATQLATVGNVNATMINYTGDEWELLT
jgi:hypothetical protein